MLRRVIEASNAASMQLNLWWALTARRGLLFMWDDNEAASPTASDEDHVPLRPTTVNDDEDQPCELWCNSFTVRGSTQPYTQQ